MKRPALLPAFLILLATTLSSCDKTEVAPEPAAAATEAAAVSALAQGKALVTTVTGTYRFTYTNSQGQTVTENRQLLNGQLRITNFMVSNGTIYAIGMVRGSTSDFGAGNLPVQIPLALSQLSSSCSAMQLNYGPMSFNLNGAAITTSANPMTRVTPNQSSKNLLGNLLCSLGVLLRNPSAADRGGVVAHLNKIISQVDTQTSSMSY